MKYIKLYEEFDLDDIFGDESAEFLGVSSKAKILDTYKFYETTTDRQRNNGTEQFDSDPNRSSGLKYALFSNGYVRRVRKSITDERWGVLQRLDPKGTFDKPLKEMQYDIIIKNIEIQIKKGII